MIYHMQDDKNESLDHIIKKNYNKIQLIFFLNKLLTDMKTHYWLTELEIICLVWTVKKICHMINESLADTIVWTDHSAIIQIMKQTILINSFMNKLNLCLIQASQYCSQFCLDFFLIKSFWSKMIFLHCKDSVSWI